MSLPMLAAITTDQLIKVARARRRQPCARPLVRPASEASNEHTAGTDFCAVRSQVERRPGARGNCELRNQEPSSTEARHSVLASDALQRSHRRCIGGSEGTRRRRRGRCRESRAKTRSPSRLPTSRYSLRMPIDTTCSAYSEDDIEFKEEHVRAFFELTPHLHSDEIAGFLRYEVNSSGRWTFPDVHGNFHWKPESVRRRGENLIAEFTNEHAASYMLTREQLKRVVASGGYLREPYEGRYEMRESAATDPYTGCGFRKVLCVSNIEGFSVHHLSDRYVDQWCVSLETIRSNCVPMKRLSREDCHRPLLPTETRFTRGQWSKNYYEPADEHLIRQIPVSARTVLSVGCGWGALEGRLQDDGMAVTALPLDAVIGASAAERGVEVVHGPLDVSAEKLKGRRFDCVVISNVLHLAPVRNICSNFAFPSSRGMGSW